MIHRAGTEIVNWYLLEEGGKVTIVDAGCPAYRRQLEGALREIGRAIEGVEAVVLTHAHIDHVGFAQALQDERAHPSMPTRASCRRPRLANLRRPKDHG